MQGGRAIKQHRMTLGYFIENVPDLRRLALDHLFRAAHRVHVAQVLQAPDDERLEKNQRHLLGKTALMKFQFGADDDNGASRIIDTLADQVLPNPTIFAFENVPQCVERSVASDRDRATVTAIVEQT